MKTILITGGTGLIGQVLTQKLTALGHRVKILGRAENLQASIPVYAWDIARQQIDGRAFEEVEIYHPPRWSQYQRRKMDRKAKERNHRIQNPEHTITL